MADYSRRKKKILEETKKLFEHAYEAERDMRLDMIEDMEFSYALNQWDEKDRAEREKEGRPALTIDRIGDTVRKVLGSMRQNRPAIKVLPAEGGDQETAEIINDLVREIEYSSRARSVYQTAANHQVRAGYGVLGVKGVETSGDIWAQDLRLRRFPNPFAVYFDPEAIEQDKSDGEFAFVSEWFSEHKFKRKFPKAKWPGGSNAAEYGQRNELWFSEKKARVIQCYRKMPIKKKVYLLSDTRTVYEDDISEDDLLQIETGALQVMQEREVKSHEVIRFVMSEDEIIEGIDVWPGRFIPLVPVYGEEINIEGKCNYRGIVRTARDPQRLYNFARTTNAEILMEQPRAPYLIGTSQLPQELRGIWDQANKGKLPYLPYKDNANAQIPSRQPPPTVSSGYVSEAQIASDDLQRATGIFDPSLGARSNEVSGVAIAARQQGSDTGTFLFPDNLAIAIEQIARILVDLIPYFYDTERVIRVRGEDDSEREVRINQPTLDDQGQPAIKRDLGRGKYDVRVSVGPSYATQRLEARDSMISFIQAIPGAAPYVGDLIAQNMDWPGAQEFAERLKALVPPGIIDDEEDPQMLAMQQQLQQALAAVEELQTGIERQKADADALAKAARANRDKTEAEALQVQIDAARAGLIGVDNLG